MSSNSRSAEDGGKDYALADDGAPAEDVVAPLGNEDGDVVGELARGGLLAASDTNIADCK